MRWPVLLLAIISAIVIGLDQWLKAWVVNTIPYQGAVLLDSPWAWLFKLTHTHNTGAAYSVLSAWPQATLWLATVLMALLIALAVHYRHYWMRRSVITVALALVLGGGLGNLYDRWMVGYVIDFIELTFIDFPVFNIADVAICCGAGLFLMNAFINIAPFKRGESHG